MPLHPGRAAAASVFLYYERTFSKKDVENVPWHKIGEKNGDTNKEKDKAR